MSRWPALLRDPVVLVLTAAIVGLGGQVVAWSLFPLSGILAGGFLVCVALFLTTRRASPALWFSLLASLIILLMATPGTAALIVLSLAATLGLGLAAALQKTFPLEPAATAHQPHSTKPQPLSDEQFLGDCVSTGNEEDDSETDCEEELEFEPAGELLQQWERRRLPTGEEVVETTLKLAFATGERLQTLHLPLHPPLFGIAHVHCEVVDGADLACEVDAVRAFGIRLNIRQRGSCQSPLDSYVWIAISASQTTTRAA